MNPIRLGVTATALVIAFAIGTVFVLNGSRGPAAVRVVPADGRAQASPSTAASQAVTATSTALISFTCGTSAVPVTAVGPTALVNAIRTGSHAGYDRLVIEFASGVPGSITVTPQQRPTFTASPRGDSITLAGSSGLHVVMHEADAHTSYSGPVAFKPNGAALLEVRRIEDFEGYVGLGLGLASGSCYRAFMLTSPTRLVIDVPVA
jgi:hypothetical protein